jgi:pSer/pThr/pTyr-binding forkhead associated (FHA) protein
MLEQEMATIILAKYGVVLQRIPLLKERTTIGRRTYNDIVIDAPGISAEHAVIVTAHNESCFEDMGSTNGSQINGQPAKIHFLQDGDVIELAEHTITYQAEDDTDAALAPTASTATMSGKTRAAAHHAATGTLKPATIRIMSGPHAGKEMALTKVLTTIGRPGMQVAAFTINAQGCSLTHVEGDSHPAVNGTSIGLVSRLLADGDVIALSDTEIVFYANGD